MIAMSLTHIVAYSHVMETKEEAYKMCLNKCVVLSTFYQMGAGTALGGCYYLNRLEYEPITPGFSSLPPYVCTFVILMT